MEAQSLAEMREANEIGVIHKKLTDVTTKLKEVFGKGAIK